MDKFRKREVSKPKCHTLVCTTDSVVVLYIANAYKQCLLNIPWDHPLNLLIAPLSSFHGECFPTPSLAVGKHTDIVPGQKNRPCTNACQLTHPVHSEQAVRAPQRPQPALPWAQTPGQTRNHTLGPCRLHLLQIAGFWSTPSSSHPGC